MNPAYTILSLLLVSPSLADELLVSSFQPASFLRFDALTGVLERTYGPSPLAGTLGADVGPDGMVYVASETTNQVLRFDPNGSYLGAFVEDDPNTGADETGGLNGPAAVLFGPDGMLYVSSFNGDAVLRYDGRTGVFDQVFVQQAAGNLNGPDAGMAFGTDGDLYVPSFWNHNVKRYDGATGTFVSNFFKSSASGMQNPRTVLFPGDGFAYVTSEGTDEVMRFNAVTGDFVDALVTDDPNTAADETGGLDGPSGMGLGPDGHLYVASINTNQVLRYHIAKGTFLGVAITAGAGGVALPTFLLFRPRTGETCPALPNSAGDGATLVAEGSTSVSANRFTLSTHYAPGHVFGMFVQGTGGPAVPWGDGTLCVGSPLYRLGVVFTDAGGRASLELDFTSTPVSEATILPGSSWHFQFVYRDPAGPGGTGFNVSSGLRAVFQP